MHFEPDDPAASAGVALPRSIRMFLSVRAADCKFDKLVIRRWYGAGELDVV
jgi:hypothetical protein